MNLLLFLSALLSALTGVVGGGRAADVPAYEARANAVARVSVARASVVLRPVSSLPTLRRIAAVADVADSVVPAPYPLYAGRRRE